MNSRPRGLSGTGHAITEFPTHWPDDYRELVEQRIELIESNPNIALIEQPEYKRRWNVEPWEQHEERALREWLLGRLEAPEFWSRRRADERRKLADRVRRDAEFMQVAELYRGRADFDVTALVAELVESDAVPFLPVLRYKPTGLRKRARVGATTWELQRREDATRRQSARSRCRPSTRPPTSWIRRSGVCAESWTCPRSVSSATRTPSAKRIRRLVIGWAGWDHLQQAKALAAYYVRMKEQEGWAPERLTAAPRRSARTDPVAEAVAQRARPRVRHRHGRLFRRFR